LTAEQIQQYDALVPLYQDWNSRINLISRKDMDQFLIHHVVHSLALAKYMKFAPGTEILDLGTGGGFPGIPLAILWPQVRFHLIDGTAKKIKVVHEVIQSIGLTNCTAEAIRSEDLAGQYDYVTARAVTALGDLIRLARRKIKKKEINARPNGLIAYKGFPLQEESQAVRNKPHEIFQIWEALHEEYFKGKCIVFVPLYS
jgi:16S rRNA (guanine527-N7)-methyltransferase